MTKLDPTADVEASISSTRGWLQWEAHCEAHVTAGTCRKTFSGLAAADLENSTQPKASRSSTFLQKAP